MRRIVPVVAAVVALVTTACSTGSDRPPSASSTSVTASPTPTPSPSVTTSSPSSSSPSPSMSSTPSPPPPSLQLPDGAPRTLDEPVPVAELVDRPSVLAPPNAEVSSTAALGDRDVVQIAVVWRRGDDPFASEHGFVVWQRFDVGPPWRAVYAFTDRPRAGVLGIALDADDLTGDGVPDALTFEQQGGTGACGIWRVVVSAVGAATEGFRRSTCDTDIRIAGGALSVREALFRTDDPHCCPSRARISRLEWDGDGFTETSSRVIDLG